MGDEVGPDAGAIFWDLVEGRARLAAIEEVEAALRLAGQPAEVLDGLSRRRIRVQKTVEGLVAEAHEHLQRG